VEICTVGSVRGESVGAAMVDLNGHEAGNGGYSQGTPTAHRPLFYSERCHTTFSVISVPQIVPVLHTQRNYRPSITLEAASRSSMVRLTQKGTGMVRT